MTTIKIKPRIYIAGPYTRGDVAINVRRAVEIATSLVDQGYAVYLPHLTHFWHLISPHEYQYWLDIDHQWLPLCDAVLRIPGESRGADKEADLATSLGIPVYFNEASLYEDFKEHL
jgi:hypothetical protein